MNPQQDVYNTIYDICTALVDTYEGLPDVVPYPFIVMGDTQLVPDRNKSAIFANVFQTVHFWSTKKQRGTITQIMQDVEMQVRLTPETSHYHIDVLNVRNNVTDDKTTNTPLYHGVLEFELKLY